MSDKPSQTLGLWLLFRLLLALKCNGYTCVHFPSRLSLVLISGGTLHFNTDMRVHSKGSKDFDLESRSLTVLKKNFKLSVRMLKVLWYQNLVGRERILYGNSMIHNLYKKLNRTCLFILICSIVSYCYSKISRNSDQFSNWCSLCDWIKFSHYYRVINLLFRLWLYDIYGMSFKVWKRTESSWPSRSNLCQNDISGYHLRQ